MERMRAVFQEDLQASVGKPFEQIRGREFQLIGLREPTEVKQLESGNTLYVYGNYWRQYHIGGPECTVLIEVNVPTAIVVSAGSEGPGCYRPY